MFSFSFFLFFVQNQQLNMVDTSYFWLITYFLRFAAQLELDFEYVKRVLSYEVLAYLAYEGVNLCEEFEQNSSHNGIDVKACCQKMHLVSKQISIYIFCSLVLCSCISIWKLVTAIKEFVHTLSMYKKFSFLNMVSIAGCRWWWLYGRA